MHELAADGSDVEKLMKAVFIGNGEPGLVTRVAKVEQAVSSIQRAAWLIFGALLTCTGAILVDLAVRAIK